jgi:hypothetical protein
MRRRAAIKTIFNDLIDYSVNARVVTSAIGHPTTPLLVLFQGLISSLLLVQSKCKSLVPHSGVTYCDCTIRAATHLPRTRSTASTTIITSLP